ncbi:hypothetical protein JCM4814A_78020 [Streptomyces phaeofaciens JCM 4814]|uniref:Uncharacterized protein n=1 Tax=Streptomyces phaeofaciens TaxID=68254 RepID=A0A918HG09_9ACTN|nr:hypothetical protein [Streptomyces phaeofaciens]GGT60312.1 hypothetical protein GCM10010226_42160 [Streptomyces phaeofaciens]
MPKPPERPTRTRTRGRRGALWGASAAAVVCTGIVLGGCGGGGHGGDFVAVGPAGDGTPGAGTRPGPGPTGEVRLIPLDGPSANSPREEGGPSAGGTSSTQADPSAETASPAGATASGRTTPASAPTHTPAPSVPAPAPSPTSARPDPPAPAALTTGTPLRAPSDRRWCEDVTLAFHNSGGTAVRSGTVSFGTHVVDALGIDWATLGSTEPLPTPIAPGARKRQTWTVCVDSWRVPLGMHIETRDVSVRWE